MADRYRTPDGWTVEVSNCPRVTGCASAITGSTSRTLLTSMTSRAGSRPPNSHSWSASLTR
jgi:hypothetical protein